jgi:hypothetical protein
VQKDEGDLLSIVNSQLAAALTPYMYELGILEAIKKLEAVEF